MFHGKRVAVVMPAYNAATTLERSCAEIPSDIVDEVLLVDDASSDETVSVAKKLGLRVLVHPENRGYGANQKTCYAEALRLGADVVVMLHPDYQYTPKLIAAMTAMIVDGPYEVVIGSRILGGTTRAGGMPFYKYVSNRFLTAVQNLLSGSKLSEFHTGYRAFSRDVLVSLSLAENSDDFVFDNQMLAQILVAGHPVGEVSCPTAYFEEASSISFSRSVRYGLGVLRVALQTFLQKRGLASYTYFDAAGAKLDGGGAPHSDANGAG
ncbi:MAG: glycosyltransferase family 2 protein [bacterium]|nr:glycosyltransferase family 2 protein [bacterium]